MCAVRGKERDVDERIDAYLRGHENEIHADILRLVAIPSVSENRGQARRALKEFLAMAASMGFTVREAAGGDVGIATVGPDESAGAEPPRPFETMGILAHVDVVDPGDAAAWSRSPWGEISDGAVWGRGTLDDKGPLVICLWAVKALRDLGIPFRKRVSFIVGTMEEIDWEDMRAYLEESPPPDYGFTPDGEFPVINREKGYCDVEVRFGRGSHGVLGNYRIESLEAGVSANSVPDSAVVLLAPLPGVSDPTAAISAVLSGAADSVRSGVSVEAVRGGRIAVKGRGRSVHSSVPERGQNALTLLASFLSSLGRNGLIDFLADNFSADAYARSLGLQTRPEYARGEFIGPTSASPDLVRTTEDAFVMAINLRLSFGQTKEEIEAVFQAGRDRYGYSFALSQYLPALFIPKDRPFMKALLFAYEERTGMPGDFILAPGTSYAKAMPNVAAFGPILPGHHDLCHEVDERILEGEIRTCALVYADAIAAIVTSPDPMA